MRSEEAALSSEFHRRRAEAEMEMALGATKLSVAILHLELAKQHRQRSAAIASDRRIQPSVGAGFYFNGTDKES
jgi:endonuclease/exonuclease/phosphatase family metal-dependent hydrolase